MVAMTVAYICRYDTAEEPGSLFWCHAMMQFTHVRSFACREAGWENWEQIVRFGLFVQQ